MDELRLDLKDMCEKGLFDKARTIVLSKLQGMENILGEKHPGLLPYLEIAAEICESSGLKEESLLMRKRILGIWGHIFVPDHGPKEMISDIFLNKVTQGVKRPLSYDSDTVMLSDDLHIATGDNRICYAFPNEPDKCIKIDKPWNKGLYNNHKKRIKKIFMPWLADLSSNRDEAKFYQIKARNLGKQFYDHAPRFYGLTITNLGPGLVFERIRDADGRCSAQLDKFLEENPSKINYIITLLNDFYRYLCEIRLPVYCWNYRNLIVRKGMDKDNILIIDWKSHVKPNNDIPLINLSPRLAMNKMGKEFKNLISKLNARQDYGKGLFI